MPPTDASSDGSSFSDGDYWLKYGRLRGDTRSEKRQPLIDQVTNAWQDEKLGYYGNDSDDESETYPECCDVEQGGAVISLLRVFRTRRARRLMLGLVAVLLSALLFWRWHVEPMQMVDAALSEGLNKVDGGYGVQISNPFKDVIQIQELREDKIPGGHADQDGKRRLIFVGDIHGCNESLQKLMDLVVFDNSTDHLVATGDMISKGPDSAGVLDTLIAINASAVRGNHEDRIILAAGHASTSAGEQSQVSLSSGGSIKDAALLSQLSHHHLEYLRSLPVILRVPAISPPKASPPRSTPHGERSKSLETPIRNDMLVVHAGLVPAVPLTRQDPYSTMNMRSIHPYTHMPSADREAGVAWERIWNWFQARLAKGGKLSKEVYLAAEGAAPPDDGRDHSHDMWDQDRKDAAAEAEEKAQNWKDWMSEQLGTGKRLFKPAVVVYGHDSKRGLNLKKWSKGLDSACVSGGELTALIVDAWGRQGIVSVACGDQKR